MEVDVMNHELINPEIANKKIRKSVLNRALIKNIYRVSQTLNGNIFRNILQTKRYRGGHWREFEKEF